jgi:NAD(P)-dependent dehydrogenase (short-subunit alcohol dehydrogenase family)
MARLRLSPEAAAGIGRATAARFLEEGASVVLSGRRQEVLEAAQRRLDPAGGRVALLADDASSPAAAERLVKAALESVNGFQPLGRHGQPGDVGEAILFYASNGARWITGTTMPIDGGVLAARNAPPAHDADQAAA